jgi:uncharacterized protein YkwD
MGKAGGAGVFAICITIATIGLYLGAAAAAQARSGRSQGHHHRGSRPARSHGTKCAAHRRYAGHARGCVSASREGHRVSRPRHTLAQHGTKAVSVTVAPQGGTLERGAARKHAAGEEAAPASTDCSGGSLTPSSEDIEAVREATMCLINRERIADGEHPLKLNNGLAACAQGHSEDMAQRDYFSHEGPEGSTPVSRMRLSGYIYSSQIGYEVGENIAWGTLWLATPASIVESWMQSPEHRENILDANYRETGIGVYPQAPAARSEGQAGAIYTQDFGVIISS